MRQDGSAHSAQSLRVERTVYVLAGAAGLRYVERRGQYFRTFRRIKSSIDTQPPLAPGGWRIASDIHRFLTQTFRDLGMGDDIDALDSLVIIASSVAPETLLSCLPAHLRKNVLACISRDLSRVRDRDLSRHLPLHLVYRSRPSDTFFPT